METEGKRILVNYLTDAEEIAIATNKGWNVK